jgi:transposase
LRCCPAERGITAVVPSTISRKVPIRHDTKCYRLRKVIERTFLRIEEFRGTAT